MTMLSVVAMVYCALNKCNVIRNSGGATNVAYDLVCCHCGSAKHNTDGYSRKSI